VEQGRQPRCAGAGEPSRVRAQILHDGRVMGRYLIPATLTALLGLASALWWMTGQRDAALDDAARLKTELATATLFIENARAAAIVHRAHIDRLAREAAETTALLNDLETLEGQDAPLSPLLDATADRLWGR
jgi:hypothetical protein